MSSKGKVCGAGLEGDSAGKGICAPCGSKYFEFSRPQCGNSGFSYGGSNIEPFGKCRGRELLKKLPSEVVASLVEHIVAGNILMGMRSLMAEAGNTMSDAQMLLVTRYDELRALRDERFVCKHEEYWKGFFS